MSRYLWTQRQDIGPPASEASMVYDSARNHSLLFEDALKTTWAWDGTFWSQLADTGPATVGGMAYDSVRQRVVASHDATVTWEWDGDSWTQVADTGGGLLEPRLTFDEVRARTIAVGTASAEPESVATWEWDGSTWTQVADSGPSTRQYFDLTYDQEHGAIVVFGGVVLPGVQMLGDTWVWNGADWVMVADIGPSARNGHRLAYDSDRRRAVLFGGISGGSYMRDTWEWDGARWMQLQDMGPSARFNQAMAYDSGRKRIVLYGGKPALGAASPLGDTWEFAEYA